MASIQATRLKKGMLVKMAQDLFRVLELQHLPPPRHRQHGKAVSAFRQRAYLWKK
jgi:translation elongation factor P/translation initiation factor 5A